MDIRTNKVEQLTALACHLELVAGLEQPSAVDWAEAKQALADDATFLRTYIIPRIVVEPRYTGGNGRLAVYEPAPTLEVTEDESSAGQPFMVPQRKGAS